MSIAMFAVVALTLVAFLVVVFYAIDRMSKNFDKHFGVPPVLPTEDDPEFIKYLERKLGHLED